MFTFFSMLFSFHLLWQWICKPIQSQSCSCKISVVNFIFRNFVGVENTVRFWMLMNILTERISLNSYECKGKLILCGVKSDYIPIKCQCCPHIETSQLICCGIQLTGSYMRKPLPLTGLSFLSSRYIFDKQTNKIKIWWIWDRL